MDPLEIKLIALNEAITERNIFNQISLISELKTAIQQSEDHVQIIQDLLNLNLGAIITDMISSKLIILEPTMKLMLNFMDNYDFRGYQFLPIMQNIFRCLVFFVHGDEVEKSQLEFFDVITILDVLMEKYLQHDFSKTAPESMQPTFLCVMKFVELVLSSDCMEEAVKCVTVEIYLHLLRINEMFKCIFGSFELTTKLANLGDELLDKLFDKFKGDRDELWLYKILQVLLRFFESFIIPGKQSLLAVRVFEHFFSHHVRRVAEQLMSPDFIDHDPQLFKLFISILNAVLWTTGFSQRFYSNILKKCVKLNVDSKVFPLAKSSRKISKHTSFTMKIFLAAFVVHSTDSIFDKHKVLNTLLESRLFNSLTDVEVCDVRRNYKALIFLYSCSFFRARLSSPLNANRVVENFVTILRSTQFLLEDEELWTIVSSFCYFSHKAILSQLELAGVQKTSELLVEHVSRLAFNHQRTRFHIDKHIYLLSKEFSTNACFLNSFTFMYLSQRSTNTSSKVAQLIPSHNLLPLLTSSDRNQVENAVKLLRQKSLNEDDINFIVEQSFANVKSDEIVIGAAICLINLNSHKTSTASVARIFRGTLAYLEAKQVADKIRYSREVYMCLMRLCANLVKSHLIEKCDCHQLVVPLKIKKD